MSRKKIKALLAAVLAAVLLTVLAYAVFSTYNTYTETVIQQRQQHLLIIARAVSQSLDLYLSEQLRDVETAANVRETAFFIDLFIRCLLLTFLPSPGGTAPCTLYTPRRGLLFRNFE